MNKQTIPTSDFWSSSIFCLRNQSCNGPPPWCSPDCWLVCKVMYNLLWAVCIYLFLTIFRCWPWLPELFCVLFSHGLLDHTLSKNYSPCMDPYITLYPLDLSENYSPCMIGSESYQDHTRPSGGRWVAPRGSPPCGCWWPWSWWGGWTPGHGTPRPPGTGCWPAGRGLAPEVGRKRNCGQQASTWSGTRGWGDAASCGHVPTWPRTHRSPRLPGTRYPSCVIEGTESWEEEGGAVSGCVCYALVRHPRGLRYHWGWGGHGHYYCHWSVSQVEQCAGLTVMVLAREVSMTVAGDCGQCCHAEAGPWSLRWPGGHRDRAARRGMAT